MVGWGGSNGTTVTAGILANQRKLSWRTREGVQTSNYYGSMVMSSTVKLGNDEQGQSVYVPIFELMPFVHPNDLVVGGWDICGNDLATAMDESQVLEPDLKRQIYDDMKKMVPLPSIYSPNFIAENQGSRANNLVNGSKREQLERIRSDIREFKRTKGVDKVVVLWTATTERWSMGIGNTADTAEGLMKVIDENNDEVSPSTIFAVASILEDCVFINGSPQNTLVKGVMDLALKHNVFIAGDDFKTGQTKLKAVMTDYLLCSGLKPLAITSYNHLGNNDGKNLSAPLQFRSKEISKTNLVDDMVSTNRVLFEKAEKPDHTVVIKYVPAVGDSKRAMDEYYSEIFMGGRNTIAIHNTCEDSLLAAPIIIDLVIVAELMTRIKFLVSENDLPLQTSGFKRLYPILSSLAFFLKAPQGPEGVMLNQSLFHQRSVLENFFKACAGINGGDFDVDLITGTNS